MSFSILQLFINILFFDFSSSYFYVLSSKFNWKPVFKSQINHAFIPTMPNIAARGLFTEGLYLAYNQPPCYFIFYISTFILNTNP